MLSIDPHNYQQGGPLPNSTSPSPLERFWLFAEHGFHTVASTVIALLTFFIDARWFVLLTGVALLGIHRSKALKGLQPALQVFIYAAFIILLVAFLWPIGKRVNESRDEAVTLLNRVIQRLNPQPVQQASGRADAVPSIPHKSPHRAPSPSPPSPGNPLQITVLESSPPQGNRPFLIVLNVLKQPPIPLDKSRFSKQMIISTLNHGQQTAISASFTAKFVFSKQINPVIETKNECHNPSSMLVGDGPGIGSGVTERLTTGVATDYAGLEKQLLDTNGSGELHGFLVGCILYEQEGRVGPFHSAFILEVSFKPTSPQSRKVLREFRLHKADDSSLELRPEDVLFTPYIKSPYYF